MNLRVYLTFDGRCEEAMNFYKTCLGGTMDNISYFKDGPPEMGGQKTPEALMDKVMHAEMKFGNNLLMGSDSMRPVEMGNQMTLSLNLTDVDKADDLFRKLSEGGTVTMPFEQTFWGAKFGMFTDQFGMNWMINCDLK